MRVADDGDGVNRAYTWASLDAAVERSAVALARLGVGPGDRVGTLLGNGAEYVLLLHALMRLGSVVVPLNTRLAPDELGWQARDAGLRLLVHDAERGASARAAAPPGLATSPIHPITEDGGLGAGGSRGSTLQKGRDPVGGHGALGLDLSALHGIVYTSGTTGRPKGAVLTYGNHFWSAVGSAMNLGVRRDDVWLAALPLFHVGGLAMLFRSLIFRTPLVVHRSFDPAAVNRAIDEEGVTLVSVVATMLRRMNEDRAGRPYPRSLRAALLGGGPAPLPLLGESAALGLPVLQTYGMTETASQAATLSPHDARHKPGSAGKPIWPLELRVEAEGGGEALAGEPGEILVRGPNVSPGYWGRPQDTELTRPGGWFRTGDVGRLDAEGYLHVLDRREDLFISGGENVYPAEVEAALLAHPAVADAGVTGLPDLEWGAAPAAWVVPRPGVAVSPEELRAHCRRLLAPYKTPTVIVFVESLPRNAGGKLLRRQLRALRPTAASRPGPDG
jgi:O-succinylbenzoic acid--CoA ligase